MKLKNYCIPFKHENNSELYFPCVTEYKKKVETWKTFKVTQTEMRNDTARE